MGRNLVTLASFALAAIALPGSAAAQDPPPTDPLDTIRGRSTFTAADDQAVDDWLTARIDELETAADAWQVARDDLDADLDEATDLLNTARSGLLDAFRSQLQHADNTPAFVGRFAERSAQVMAARLGDGSPPATVAWCLPRVLVDMNRIETRSALIAGLGHATAAVRGMSAIGLARLRPQIAPDAAMARATIGALQSAAVTEANSVALAAMYEAAGYSDRPQESLSAYDAIFGARIDKRKNRQLIIADRAELAAFSYLKSIRRNVPEPAKAPLVRSLAAFLTLDVGRYPDAPAPEKTNVHERIEGAESLLETLVGAGSGGGNVRRALRGGGPAADIDMKLELLKWVGSEAEPGVLNAAPWRVPVGGL
ncbi:MAG: hypothetical protein GY778_29175 [bacterium]|nr:hypothetical protein [bacterium]